MAKLNYVEGDYKEALNIYARVGLDDVPLTAAAPYRLRMIAEAFATKGEARAPLPSPREGCPRVVLFGARRASRSVHFDSHGPGWRLTRTTPSKASGLAPLCARRDFKASDTSCLQSLSSSIITEGNEGKTLQSFSDH